MEYYGDWVVVSVFVVSTAGFPGAAGGMTFSVVVVMVMLEVVRWENGT
jgi:hypothetical protein